LHPVFLLNNKTIVGYRRRRFGLTADATKAFLNIGIHTDILIQGGFPLARWSTTSSAVKHKFQVFHDFKVKGITTKIVRSLDNDTLTDKLNKLVKFIQKELPRVSQLMAKNDLIKLFNERSKYKKKKYLMFKKSYQGLVRLWPKKTLPNRSMNWTGPRSWTRSAAKLINVLGLCLTLLTLTANTSAKSRS
jgi:hypothetical protein